MGVRVEELRVADEPDAWRDAGFAVDGEVGVVGSVRLRFVGRAAGRGIVGWTLSGVPEVGDVDGIATSVGFDTPLAGARGCSTDDRNDNGVVGIDHLVVLTPDLARTVAALSAIGLEPRRQRDGELGGAAVRQVFYRTDNVILEVVGNPGTQGSRPAELWGITFTVADIDASAAHLGDRLGRVKDAVQPGRRIATLRGRDIGISTQVALITPHVRATPA